MGVTGKKRRGGGGVGIEEERTVVGEVTVTSYCYFKCNETRTVVGEVTVTKLLRCINGYFFKVTGDSFVTFKIAVTSSCNGTVTFRIG